MTAPERGDLVWLDLAGGTGHEQQGRRPMLVLSPRAYNEKIGLGLFCPVTSRTKGYPFEVALPEGTDIRGVVLADQVKSLDWRKRRPRRAGKAAPGVLAEVSAKIAALLGSRAAA